VVFLVGVVGRYQPLKGVRMVVPSMRWRRRWDDAAVGGGADEGAAVDGLDGVAKISALEKEFSLMRTLMGGSSRR